MQELFDLFEEMGYKLAEGYFRQGSLTDENYPDKFFTYWNIDTPNDSYYDNHETRYIEYVQVCFYTNNSSLIYSQMDDFINRAKQKGFVIQGRAHDTPADKDNYFGRLVLIKIIHKEK